MKPLRTYALSVAGLDPSGGAGLLADIKTMESHKVYGLGVISANTFQNDSEFSAVDWLPFDKIKAQIDMLWKRFSFEYVKIGIIENLQVLEKLILYLREINGDIKITWDPVLSASAGFEFHTKDQLTSLNSILPHLYLITPNYLEAIKLGKSQSAEENAAALSVFCHVYLKGGHKREKVGYDTLYLKNGKQFSFRPKHTNVAGKHGSGCVLSSSLTANLARGKELRRACLEAKEYTERFLNSNGSLLGYHKL